jgi:hypothetical protein
MIFYTFNKFCQPMAHNIPVVCDVLPAAIKELRSNSSGGQNVPEKNRTLVPVVLVPVVKAPKRIQSCYVQWRRFNISLKRFLR